MVKCLCSLFCLWFAMSTVAPPMHAQSCNVIDGLFERAWGGMNHNGFMLDPFSSVAWTVEDGGRIRLSTNSGTSWTSQTTPPCVQDVLRGAHFLHNGPIRTGWAVGDGGHVLGTVDAGSSWQALSTELYNGEPAELWDVYFLNANDGWIGGNHVLRSTIDGGVNWANVTGVHPQDPNFQIADVEIYSVDFVETSAGYIGLASVEPGIILRTDHTTNGTVWDVVYDFCFEPPLCSTCAPPPSQCATAEFEVWDIELQKNTDNDDQIIAVASGGFGNQCGHTLVSSDSGLTWQQEFNIDDPCNTNAACSGNGTQDGYPTQYGTHVLDNASAISVGYGGTVYVRDTTCTPAVWQQTSPITGAPTGNFTQPFYGVDGNGSGDAWTTAMFNGLFQTTDGGNSWTPSSDGNDVMRLQDVYFDDENKGWAVGQFFRITQTLDGGTTWNDQPYTLGAGNLRDIVFQDNALDGVAVGGYYDGSGNPQIQYTGDGGTTWNGFSAINGAQPLGDRNLYAVDHTRGDQYWAVGSNSMVIYSADGGANWDIVPVDPGGVAVSGLELTSVSFADQNTGAISGRINGEARVFVVFNATNPATRVWFDHSPPSSANVLDFQGVAVQGNRAYAVGKKLVAGEEVGVVYAWNGVTFVEDTTVPAVESCSTWDSTATSPQLLGRFNEVAIPTSGPEVFVGATCGRFLRYDGATWEELKSHTSYHIGGMSFFAGDQGFLLGDAGSHNVIVEYDAR